MSDILDGLFDEQPAASQPKGKEPGLLEFLDEALGPKEASAAPVALVPAPEVAASATTPPVAAHISDDVPIDAVVEVAAPVVDAQAATQDSVKITVEYNVGAGRKKPCDQRNFSILLELLGKMNGLEVQTKPMCEAEAK